MSLRLAAEDGLAAYLTTASKPAGLYVQAGHRIADLQLPACIVHAESSVPVVEGSLATTRKVTFTCSIMTPLEVASTGRDQHHRGHSDGRIPGRGKHRQQ
ncbi:MAG: hypothetical protein EBT03_12085 [Betaproteobacteria bacterium]|nr:hypothetical protein [Betaproteobacteria bacterium]